MTKKKPTKPRSTRSKPPTLRNGSIWLVRVPWDTLVGRCQFDATGFMMYDVVDVSKHYEGWRESKLALEGPPADAKLPKMPAIYVPFAMTYPIVMCDQEKWADKL